MPRCGYPGEFPGRCPASSLTVAAVLKRSWACLSSLPAWELHALQRAWGASAVGDGRFFSSAVFGVLWYTARPQRAAPGRYSRLHLPAFLCKQERHRYPSLDLHLESVNVLRADYVRQCKDRNTLNICFVPREGRGTLKTQAVLLSPVEKPSFPKHSLYQSKYF